ncbi:AmmeMemoRadiSam system protein B [Magnetospira thiophila]
MSIVRRPAVAGTFYADQSTQLHEDVLAYLSQVKGGEGPVPKAVIVPHAGYIYSGPVAASVYARLRAAHDRLTKVVLIGPCHRVAVRGFSVSSSDAWRTPLGDVPLDREACDRLCAHFNLVNPYEASHQNEHSLEVHLPFLQEVLGHFTLLPLLVGNATGDQVAEVLDAVWGGPETLIVISSDLSHYLDYKEAKAADAQACEAIEHLDPKGLGKDSACGRIPVSGLLTLAQRRGLRVETLDLRNSGDTAGPKDRVVGYGAWAFFETESGQASSVFAAQAQELLERHGETLLRLAATSIREALAGKRGVEEVWDDYPRELRKQGACFVTLKRDGQLRGCIGSVMAHQPLLTDVAKNAQSAAFRDPRFPPLTAEEMTQVELSLSLLSPPWPIACKDEEDLLAQLRPGIDGLIISDTGHRALFLPSVWRELPDKKQFLAHLKRKAGLPIDHWSDTFRAERFIAAERAANDLPDPSVLWAE